MAEFAAPAELIAAVRRLRGQGYVCLDAFTPYPLVELDLPSTRMGAHIARAVLAGALIGAAGGYVVQWCTALDYPLRVGAMPIHAGPAFVPIAFESAILAGAIAGLIAWAVVTGLPRWWDEVFLVPGFERATSDRYFLFIDARDPQFAPSSAADLTACGPLRVIAVADDR